MSSSTLQARIRAFEALGTGASKDVLESVAIHSEPEHLLDRPHSPSAASIPPMLPTTYSPSASPRSLGHKSSLIDLKDWVIDDGFFHASPPTPILTAYSPLQTAKRLPHENAPLISFEGSPQKTAKAPPLPPRGPSLDIPRSVSDPIPPQTDQFSLTKLSAFDGIRRNQGHAQVSSVSSFHSVSLSSDGDDSTTASAPRASPMEREWTGTGTEDGESLDESFEDVSAPSSFLPPTTLPPRPPKPPALTLTSNSKPPAVTQPPKLPQRPSPQPRGSPNSLTSQSSLPSTTSLVPSPAPMLTPDASGSSTSLTSTRRLPPPPPPPSSAPAPSNSRSRPPSARVSVQSTTTTASDRSSLFSQVTTTSRTSLSSRHSFSTPTPGPGAKHAIHARYDALFIANMRARAPPKPLPSASAAAAPTKRQNAGWRGLSIDVEPIAYSAPATPEPGPDARLDGRLVRKIWLKSRLEPHRLRDIWNMCDAEGTGSLDREGFARGMARIDEELRRAQVLGRSSAGSSAGSSTTSIRTPRPPGLSRPILR